MKDLTKGKPYRVLLAFAIPLYLSQLFSSLYGLVDTRIIGGILGEPALAAVGATTALSDLLLEFVGGVICGFGIVVSRFCGARDGDGARRAIGQTVLLGLALTAAISGIVLCLLDPILRLMNIELALAGDARAYIVIVVGGLIAASAYNSCAAVLRAFGDSVTPLVFLAVSNALNVGVDYLFVGVFHMGVRGAAWATVFTQALSAALSFAYLWRRYPALRARRADLKPDWAMAQELLPMGVSMGFMLSFVLLGSLILQTAINRLGQGVIVAHTGARRLTILLLIPFFALGSALSTYCGQNLGAKRYGRIREGIAAALTVAAIWWGVALLAVWTLGGRLTALVTASRVQGVIDNAVRYLRVNSAFYLLPAVICILRNSMQGFGDARTPLISSVIELLGKVAVAYLLVPVWRYMGVIVAEPIVWAIMVIPLLAKWRKQRRVFNE